MAVTTIDLGRVVGPKGDPGEGAIVDAVPASGSENAVSSGGTYTALQGKADVPTGAVTTVMASDLSANKVVISNGSGKLAASDVTATQLESVQWLGYYGAQSIASSSQTNTQHTELFDELLTPGVYIVTGWCEIQRITKSGRYGLQFYLNDSPVPVCTNQNYYENPDNVVRTSGWNIVYIANVAENTHIKLSLLCPVAISDDPVTIVHGLIQTVRLK